MTRVMDGVGGGVSRTRDTVLVAPERHEVRQTPQPLKRPVGRPPLRANLGRFDGVRRPQPVRTGQAAPAVEPVERPAQAVAPAVQMAAAPAAPAPAATQSPVSRLNVITPAPAIPRRPAAESVRPAFAPTSARPVPASTRPLATTSDIIQPLPRPVIQPVVRRPFRSFARGWHRPAMAGAAVLVALTASVVAVRSLSTPPASTAHADQSVAPSPAVAAAHTVAPTPAPATPAPSVDTQSAGLQSLLNTFAATNPGKFAIVVKDLKTGAMASIDPNRSMTSASLYKLFVAKQTLQRVDLGQAQLTAAAGGGTGRTIDGCLTLMITISDNGCGRALGSLLGWGAQNHALGVEGYAGTNLATPQQTSAQDVAMLFEKLYRGTLLSPASTAKFMGLLKNQRVNNRLPLGLPTGTTFAHKTGDLDGYVHDAGIVYGPKTDYLVVVMSGSWNTPGNAPALFVNLSKQLWATFEQ